MRAIPLILLLNLVLLRVSGQPAGLQEPAKTSSRFKLFISSAARDDVVEINNGLQDSVKDFSGRFAKSKIFELVHNANDADIVLVVVQRGTGQASFNRRFESSGRSFGTVELTETTVIASKTYWLSAVLMAGNYNKEFFAGYANQGLQRPWLLWSQDAKDISDKVTAWVTANAAQLKIGKNGLKNPGQFRYE
jgi:hypothetical protein